MEKIIMGERKKEICNDADRVRKIAKRIVEGNEASEEEVLWLAQILEINEEGRGSLEETGLRDVIREEAAAITRALHTGVFDSCSIVNARSGRCGEDCKWCAQSAHYNTQCDVYGLISAEECHKHADASRRHGIGRFSMVTSGRKMHGAELERACEMMKAESEEGDLRLCASMGLLERDELRMLKEAGLSRYHCNLEAAPEYFEKLCSTHSVADKLRSIEYAREEGLEICSGGIIGMGETMRHRALLALELRKARPVSIPINILCPIEGTPLSNADALSEDEILDTVALFRFVHPRVILRFAGGRARLSRNAQKEALRIGVNGAITGDLLTTVGSTVEADRELAAEAGMSWGSLG